jgi:hypothetical protein
MLPGVVVVVACGVTPDSSEGDSIDELRRCGPFHRCPDSGAQDSAVDSARDAGVDAAKQHSVSLQWVASSTPGVTYNLYRGTVSGGPYTVVQSGITTVSTTDSNVTSGTTYYYVVRAADSDGESANSNEIPAAIPSP